MSSRNNYYYPNIDGVKFRLKDIKSDEFILMTHLGLGDHIILNGLVNHLSEKFKKIHLTVHTSTINNIEYLYSQNKKVRLIELPKNDELKTLENYSFNNKLEILQLGFSNVKKTPFNIAYYRQLKIPYSYSLNKYFKPEDENKEIELQEQLIKYYSANPSQIVLIHNESSKGTFELKNIKSNNNIYITKESDIYNNLFLYSKIISEAYEIHCLDSSFLHLVERTKTNAKLYFHDLFGASVRLSKNWYYVRYEH